MKKLNHRDTENTERRETEREGRTENETTATSLLIVVLTSSNLQSDVDKAYELGANSYLVKPVEFDDMVNLIKRFEAYWTEINRVPTTPKAPIPAPM